MRHEVAGGDYQVALSSARSALRVPSPTSTCSCPFVSNRPSREFCPMSDLLSAQIHCTILETQNGSRPDITFPTLDIHLELSDST